MADSRSPEQQALEAIKEELRQREYEIRLLRETALAVGSELDLETVLELIAARARELIQSETLLIPILNEPCNEYTYRAGSGANVDEIVGESLPLEFGVCGWVWRHKKPWWRGMLDELTAEERNQWEKEAGTLILVPLVGRRHFLGGLAGINKQGGGDFNKRDLHLLELFAGHAAIAIENAMAMEEVEKAHLATENYQHQLQKLNKSLGIANQELEYLSLYDQLTGLPNRSLFRDRVKQQLESCSRGETNEFSLLIIDIDRFQEINNSVGQDAGDKVLRLFTERLKETLQTKYTLSRMSGDEFALLLPETDEKGAIGIAENLRDSLRQPIFLQKLEVFVSATIGIATYPQHGTRVSELVKNADAAMNTAKREKHGIHLFDPDMDGQTPGRLTLVSDLQNALDNREFQLHYQPKIALATGSIVGVEALARWPHKTRGPVPPDMFISALEQTGLIAPFSYWVIETALSQRTVWLEQGRDIKIAINIPINLILEPNFVTELSNIVDRFPNADGLAFEITENIFMSDYDRLNTILRQIEEFGINFSIDDFGTGHSSLSRLRQLPVTEIKIDRSFVMEMLNSKDDATIVKSTIDLAHNLGLRVVAEGVENSQIMEQLFRLRCDVVQGYHISKALSADQFDAFLEKTKWGINGSSESNQSVENNS